jgi:uncharacterized membrane protein YvlD (DUF360 family)
MNEAVRQVLRWGWFRFVLGVMQMTLAAMGAGALLTRGLCSLTWGLVVSATAVSLLSRLLYRGQPRPVSSP